MQLETLQLYLNYCMCAASTWPTCKSVAIDHSNLHFNCVKQVKDRQYYFYSKSTY